MKKFYKFSIILVLFICLFATGCKKNKNKNKKIDPVDVTSIVYNNSQISWGSVENAGSYQIYINDVLQPTKAYTNTYFYNSAQSFKFGIVVEGNDTVSEKVEKTFNKLDSVDIASYNFSNGSLTWSAVNGASSYIIEVNGKEISTPLNTYTGFDKGMVNKIRIKPCGPDSSFFALYNDFVTKEFFAEPSNVKYDGQFITWYGTPSCKNYEVYINGSFYKNLNGTMLEYDSKGNNFTVEIKAVGDEINTFSSDLSEKIEFISLDIVSNIKVADGIVSWEPVENASEYLVEVKGSPVKTVVNPEIELKSGTTQQVTIKPVAKEGTVYFSQWSPTFFVTILNSPTLIWNNSLALDGEAARSLYWNSVIGEVSGYEVSLTTPNGAVESHTINVNDPSFLYDYLEEGTYTVKVKSLAQVGGDSYDSKYSTPITVVRLPAPKKAKIEVTSDNKDISKGATLFYDLVSGATKYQLYKDGIIVEGATSIDNALHVNQIVPLNATEEQTITYSVQSVGSKKQIGDQYVITLNSLTSNNQNYVFTVLPTPTNVDISGETLTWDKNSGANGYYINIGSLQYSSQNNFSLSQLPEGDSNVSVCSSGDGSYVLPSNYSSIIKVYKLHAPHNIRVNTTVSEGKLTFDSDNFALSNDVYFNGSENPIDADTIDNINKYITVNTVSVFLKSVADYWNDEHTMYYLSSNKSATKQFTKLPQVNLSFTNNELVWTFPSNIDNNYTDVSYEVYDEKGYKLPYQVEGTKMNLSMLEGRDENYTFRVKVIGNGITTLNSDLSDPASISKLKSPEVSVSNNCYVWNSVPGTVNYQVLVDGNVVANVKHVSGQESYEYVPAFSEIKRYSVSFVAVGDGGHESLDSKPSVITQNVIKYATPNFKISYSHDSYDLNGNIIVTVTEESPYALYYKVLFNGILVQTEKGSLTCEYNPRSTGTFVVSLIASGGSFDEVGNYYIDSTARGGNSSYQITLLESVNESSISIDLDGRLKWDPITNASKYRVEIIYNDGTESVVKENVTSTLITVQNSKNVAKVIIYAVGNGITTITATPTTWIVN